MAGLIQSKNRGLYQITEEGLKVFNSKQKVDKNFLMNYESFIEFKNHKGGEKEKNKLGIDSEIQELEDSDTKISNAIEELNELLKDDLLNAIKEMHQKNFEQLIVILME